MLGQEFVYLHLNIYRVLQNLDAELYVKKIEEFLIFFNFEQFYLFIYFLPC